jgi:hypothetical protein
MQHIYIDERAHGVGVSSSTPRTHVLRLIVQPKQPWLAASPDMPFLETARDQANSWKSKSREMKLDIKPRPRLREQNGQVTYERPYIPTIRLRQGVDENRIMDCMRLS